MRSPRSTVKIKTIRCHDIFIWLIRLSMDKKIYDVCEKIAAHRRTILKISDEEVYKDEYQKIYIDVLVAKKTYIKHAIDKKKTKLSKNRIIDLYSAIYIVYMINGRNYQIF